MTPCIVMLLDNHYGPDPRVEFEAGILLDAGCRVRIVAWDRRTEGARVETEPFERRESVVRVPVPAPPGGGLRSILNMSRFALHVWKRRAELFRDADVLVAHDVYLLPLVVVLARVLRKPFLYDAHEDFEAMEGSRYPRVVVRSVVALEGWLARRARGVVVPGESRTPRWESIGIKPYVLPNLGRYARRVQVQRSVDVVYCGGLIPARRLDLFVEAARRRPNLTFAIGGAGRDERSVRAAASELPNLVFAGWQSDPDTFLATGRVVYYGHDPEDSYAEKTCPNTLYQAMRVNAPLVFFCGGEPASLLARFKIGIKSGPTAEELVAAIDSALADNGWESSEAWEWVLEGAQRVMRDYADLVWSLARNDSL